MALRDADAPGDLRRRPYLRVDIVQAHEPLGLLQRIDVLALQVFQECQRQVLRLADIEHAAGHAILQRRRQAKEAPQQIDRPIAPLAGHDPQDGVLGVGARQDVLQQTVFGDAFGQAGHAAQRGLRSPCKIGLSNECFDGIDEAGRRIGFADERSA